MKKTLISAALATAVSVTAPAMADIGVGVVGGTQGVGAYVGYKINDTFSLRLQGSKWNITQDNTIDDIEYKLDADIGAVGLYADIFPFQGSFRITAGISKSLLDASATNTATEVATIGDVTVTINPGEVSGNLKFDTAPYFGIGWGSTVPEGWGMRFDIGAYLLGKADVTYTVTGNARTQLDAAATLIGSTGDAEIAKEEQKARDDIGDVIYPNISLSISYGW